ncbi:MAG: OmpA family protein [Sphingobacteriaceae bacterium]|jgi:OmpA-OmpF porin, OOP family|nr:OmpA family protein [Sphingobacteriaceae bacterium]
MRSKKTLSLLLFIALTANSIIAQKLKPTDKLALLMGVVKNFKGNLLANETIIFVNDKTKTSYKANTDASGKFELLIPISGTYSLRYKKFTTDVDYTKMNVPADKEATYEVEIKIDPPKDFVLENVYFETGKSNLKPNSFKALDDLVEILKIKTTMAIEIQGHTDNVGKEEDNLKLSQERANEVRKYLITKGIAETRVSAKGYGQTMPVADNGTETGKAKNRRTSLKVIKE